GAIEELSGVEKSHWLETPDYFSERIHPDDRAATMAAYRAAISRGGDAYAEFRAASGLGHLWLPGTVWVSGAAITGVTTATRAPVQPELPRAEERSDALPNPVGRLVRNLQNPLTIVTGYGEELLNTLDPRDPRRDDVEQIIAAAERMSGL